MGTETSEYMFALSMVNTLATCNLLEAFFADTHTDRQIDRQSQVRTDAKAYLFTSAKYV